VGELWDLWSRWLSGRGASGASLWGAPVLWWGRWGKLLEFAAGLAVVLDLIGPEPLRAFGHRMASLRWDTAGERFGKATNVLTAIVVAVCLVGYVGLVITLNLSGVLHLNINVPDLSQTWIATWWGTMLVVVVWYGIAFLAISIFGGTDKQANKNIGQVAFFFAPAVVLILVLLAVVLSPWLAFIYLLLVPAARILAWLLDRNRPAHPVRWLALVMFVVGFHFDLLAS
jgi:hypothetical protein